MYKGSIQRFKKIVTTLGYYGFGHLVNSKLHKQEKSPENLRKAFEELGPTFIKIGQILSTRPDILPPAYIVELSKLQDGVTPESPAVIHKVFFNEFHTSIKDAFLSFNEVPLASASIAQVHAATLKNGKEVIVKIQRPDIAEKMHLDLSILHRILRLTKARFADALMDPKEVLDEIFASMELELNFDTEAKNIMKFKALNKDVAFVHCPYLIGDLCSEKVLTMEKINGIKINDIAHLEVKGYDLNDLGKKLTLSYFKQVFEDGFFHGDPHPGNLLIREGKICYIDFGIMGNLTPSLKSILNDMILAVAYRHTEKMITAILTIGIKRGPVNKNKLYEDLEYLFDNYLDTTLRNIRISVLLQEIFDISKRNNLKFPKDLTLLIRSLVIIEGVVAKIAPDIKILDIAIPYVKSTNKFPFINNFNIDDLLLHSYIFARDTTRLPSKLIDVSDSILNGRAKLQLEHKNLPQSTYEISKAINRLIIALIISSMIISSSSILNSNIGPSIRGISIVGITGFIVAAFMGLWLFICILRSGKI